MLSVLIPVYNCSVVDLIIKLHHQLSAENIDFEIIAQEDGSTLFVETNNVKLNHYLHVIKNKNNGRIATRISLAQKAKHPQLLFLDADIDLCDDFIKQYLNEFDPGLVMFGGYKYLKDSNKKYLLRYRYGLQRESKLAIVRQKKPYQSIFSGNLWLAKSLFLSLKLPQQNIYGTDVMLAYQLKKLNAKIKHLNNPILHLGIENDDIFWQKILNSVQSLKLFYEQNPDIKNVNNLLSYYDFLKQTQLNHLMKLIFNFSKSFIYQQIFKPNASLRWLDIYKLGYLCSLK